MRRFRFPPPSPPEPSSAPVPDLNTFLGRLDARLDELETRLRSIEEERPRNRPRYASPDELAREFGINDQTLRGWLFSRAENGLDALVVNQGRRLYLDREAFARWFARGEGRPAAADDGKDEQGADRWPAPGGFLGGGLIDVFKNEAGPVLGALESLRGLFVESAVRLLRR